MFGGGASSAAYPVNVNLIPMSLSDPRFAGNVAGGFVNGNPPSSSNKDWIDNPAYLNGNAVWFSSGGAQGSITISKCRFDWREGPRIDATDGSTLTMDQCFVNCIGFGADHADGIQAQGGGGATANLVVTNSGFRSYDDAEAIALYGGTAVASDAIFWADASAGTVTLNNVLILGGSRGIAVYADTGKTVHVNFNNVFFVPTTGSSFVGFKYDIKVGVGGGTLVVDNWTNVCDATIVNGVIIPGAQLPSP